MCVHFSHSVLHLSEAPQACFRGSAVFGQHGLWVLLVATALRNKITQKARAVRQSPHFLVMGIF